MQNEIWKDIDGHERFYQISSFGRVKRLGNSKTRKERIFNPHKNRYGYLSVELYNGIRLSQRVHRLVCNAFLPNPELKRTVNHKNGIKDDNRLSNLEWATYSENNLHSYRVLGRVDSKKYGKDNHKSKPVLQFTLKGKLIAEYESMGEVQRKLNIRQSGISKVCHNKGETAGGYIWMFAENYYKIYNVPIECVNGQLIMGIWSVEF